MFTVNIVTRRNEDGLTALLRGSFKDLDEVGESLRATVRDLTKGGYEVVLVWAGDFPPEVAFGLREVDLN